MIATRIALESFDGQQLTKIDNASCWLEQLCHKYTEFVSDTTMSLKLTLHKPTTPILELEEKNYDKATKLKTEPQSTQ
jgi:hypothetical protein